MDTSAALAIALAGCSEPGARTHNEDDLRYGREGAAWYAVVADGAGGHRGGAEASLRAVQSLEAAVRERPPPWQPRVLSEAVMAAHAEVLRGQGGAQGHERMLTTVVALWVDAASRQALWSHVGDSRLYRLRLGVIDYRTSDDSVVQRLFDAGLLTESQREDHPYKNQLIAALGMSDEVDPHTVAHPVALDEGDAFLLCSDGWWGSLHEHDIADTLNNADTPEHWLRLMRERIIERATPNQDNFSAVALWIGDPWSSSRMLESLASQ